MLLKCLKSYLTDTPVRIMEIFTVAVYTGTGGTFVDVYLTPVPTET